jgi:hypothetical protein
MRLVEPGSRRCAHSKISKPAGKKKNYVDNNNNKKMTKNNEEAVAMQGVLLTTKGRVMPWFIEGVHVGLGNSMDPTPQKTSQILKK